MENKLKEVVIQTILENMRRYNNTDVAVIWVDAENTINICFGLLWGAGHQVYNERDDASNFIGLTVDDIHYPI